MAVFQGKRKEFGGCLIHEGRCLSSYNLLLKSYRISRELLVFSQHQNPKEGGSNASAGGASLASAEEMNLSVKSESKKAKRKSFPLPCHLKNIFETII